ncbi:dihydroorotate dehydrogenase (quinone), mitochondrial isoform X2 [Hydra vulgaris]|uniref:Dihydroorotate dehydrogenase (quinone), mitochondrial n=1 Tax=Hydra vulgaris TaxID=6087 RepID=A0ABM4DMX8_HYDVU
MFFTKRWAKILVGSSAVSSLTLTSLCLTTNESVWENISMPLIRMIDAERAHILAVKLASWKLVPKFKTLDADKSLLSTALWNLKFESPLGLAAGFDKNAECVDGMFKMGFGFVEVGSITPKPQYGNAKPRVFRLSQDEAIINRYGFNSFGADIAFSNLSARSKHKNGIVGVNIGKNKLTEDSAADYVENVLKFGELADYLVINISSPNTPGLRNMQSRKELQELLERVLEAREKLQNKPPLLVKISPDLSNFDKEDISAVVTSSKTKVDGLIISNTTVSRPQSLISANKNEVGGLSGKPLKDLATQCIKDMYILTGGSIPIIGVGGISNGADAFDKICNGASLVQLYTSLTIHGPPVVGKVKLELAEILRQNGFSSVKQAVGCKVNVPQIKQNK